MRLDSPILALLLAALVTVSLLATSGCHSLGGVGDLESESLLKAAEGSPDAVTLDIYWASADLEDNQFADALWSSVQEDRLSVEVRCALADNGLRAGVVGGTPSEQVLKLLNPDGTDTQPAADAENVVVVGKPTKVTRRMKQLRPGERMEVQAEHVMPSFSLLRGEHGSLTGREYADAQGIYAMELGSRDGNRVQLKLEPELHYGQPKMKYTPSGPGMVVQKLARDRESFEALQTEVDLAPGEMLVVTSLPGGAHRLGGLLHRCDEDDRPRQKYLLIRVSQVPEMAQLASDDGDRAWPWQ